VAKGHHHCKLEGTKEEWSVPTATRSAQCPPYWETREDRPGRVR
jgi:hypothetical protein